MRRVALAAGLLLAAPLAPPLHAQTEIAPGVLRYGDVDCVGFNCYGGADPTDGATLKGLAPGASSTGSSVFGHSFPFAPEGDDLAGTDQIYVGSGQTGFSDGYSVYGGRAAGPQLFTLDYGSLVGPGSSVSGLTLGIMADDFQFPAFGNLFVAMINGTESTGLSALLNGLNQTGPATQFVSFGVDPSLLLDSHVLTVSIDQAAPGGDGWAVDFLTLGATTSASVVPEPATLALVGGGLAVLGLVGRRRRTR